jgi:hypothetical protein
MEDPREGHRAMVVLAQHCPAELTAGYAGLFSGRVEPRRFEGKPMLMLDVEAVDPLIPFADTPWAQLEGVLRLASTSRTVFGPDITRHGAVVTRKITAAQAALEMTRGPGEALMLLVCEDRPTEDPVQNQLIRTHEGDYVRVSGDFAFLQPEDGDQETGLMQLCLRSLERVP